LVIGGLVIGGLVISRQDNLGDISDEGEGVTWMP